MSRFNPNRDVSDVLSAAQQWIADALIGGGSIFSGARLWTSDGLDELRRQFTDSPDEGGGSFYVKLEGQMQGASPAAIQLMAEMLWALMLFQTNIKPGTKRDNIRKVWEWSGAKLSPSHPLLRDGCLVGVAHTGMAFNQARWRELNYFIVLAGDLAGRGLDERRAIFADVGAFTDWIDSVPREGDRQLRSILRYLAFPDASERAASRQHRLKILEGFGEGEAAELRKLPEADLDSRLQALRQRLEREHGTTELDFYESPLVERWRDATPPGPEASGEDSAFEAGYQALKESFLFHMPDFRSFADPAGEYEARERAYKDELVELFREHVVPALEEQDWPKVGEQAIGILTTRLPSLSGPQNIVNWRQVQMMRALVPEARARLGRALGELFDEEQPLGARAQAFSEALETEFESPRGMAPAMQRSLAALYLTLWDPAEFFFIKTRNTREALQKLDPGFEWQRGGFFAEEAEYLASIGQRLFRRMQQDGLKPRDLIDVQGLLWVPTAYGSTSTGEDPIEGGGDAVGEPATAPGYQRAPTNRILFGPPGTGKTFHTVDRALELLDPAFLREHAADRPALKQRFDDFVDQGRVRFVTFHQSFSYEDFVEGLRADSDGEGGALRYAVADGVFKQLCATAGKAWRAGEAVPYVLIIDEINRGNVSRIFGELITLIEPSKRAGAAEALEVLLPYSKDPFSVPPNLHLIGTMNTADRSLAGMDIALRRRFEFIETPPRPALLEDVHIEGVNLGRVLETMNQRIAVLLDRDHQLGHAYFMHLRDGDPLEALARVFRNQILPLLQEYFFEDWERIGLVLNDPQKPEGYRFVRAAQHSMAQLFGSDADLPQAGRRWELQAAAFDHPESYRGIIKVDRG